MSIPEVDGKTYIYHRIVITTIGISDGSGSVPGQTVCY